MSSKGDAFILNQEGRRKQQIAKPTIIHNYNHSMNGCDRMDQAVSYYGQFERKTTKWWKKIFHWLLEVAQINAYILYSLTHDDSSRIPIAAFKEKLLVELTDKAATMGHVLKELKRSPSRGRPMKHAISRFMNGRHIIEYVPTAGKCFFAAPQHAGKRPTSSALAAQISHI